MEKSLEEKIAAAKQLLEAARELKATAQRADQDQRAAWATYKQLVHSESTCAERTAAYDRYKTLDIQQMLSANRAHAALSDYCEARRTVCEDLGLGAVE